MTYVISDEIVAKVTNCPVLFSCLNTGACIHCSVEQVVDAEHALIRCSSYPGCRHRLDYGFGCMCTCPVRIAIYQKYRN